ncbi:MAG: heavy metal sensor histidine kinase [Verrucomicrobiales bacterium]|nr:heavy metal sensor histidine kinase [Verrucomicrobiales bacterium]
MNPSSAPAQRPGKRRSISIGTRLMAAITLASAGTLTLAACYLDRAMHRGLVHEHEEMLADHLSAVRHAVLDDGPEQQRIRELLHHSIGGTKNEKSYGRLVSTDGRVIIETPGFPEASPPLHAFPLPSAVDDRNVLIHATTNSSGAPVFLAAARIAPQGAGSLLTYYMTADAVPEQHFMQAFRLELAGVVILGSLLSAVLSWWIVRRGLRPLHEITRQIESTSADILQSGQSVEPPLISQKWPGELTGVASAFSGLCERLSRSFQQIRQFSDDAAHEIRSPLNNMLGLASLTLQRGRTEEEYRVALESTVEECNRLRRLADGLLFISRADHRKHALSITRFDAAEAVREVVDYHEQLAQEKGISLRQEGAGVLIADRTLFRQALTNLLSNALRHTASGGSITITFTDAADAGGHALTVADTGEGIQPEHLAHVFDRFYRVDSARTHDPDAPPQTGLGLAIVKAIMELHGGSAAVESVPGQGARFSLLWPQG